MAKSSHNTISVFSCNLLVNMGESTSCTYLVLLLISVNYYIYPGSTQQSYPTGSLACKTYEITKMDCSNRDLFEVPLLDQNWIIELDLSHNHLRNITGLPFETLHILVVLDLSYNEISCMSSTAFKGLQSLKHLNLEFNLLVDLPKRTFADLTNLVTLNFFGNRFVTIPGETLAPLRSCEILFLTNFDTPTFEIGFGGFQNLTNVYFVYIYMQHSLN